jgi:hypothetical protein
MPAIVKLYGKLKGKVINNGLQDGLPASYEIDTSIVNSVFKILEELRIKENELSHIFVNGKYCRIDKEVENGDRVGLFPKNMSLLFVEILPQYR